MPMPSVRPLRALRWALMVLLIAAPAVSAATRTTRVSVHSNGAEANGDSSFSAMSGDGRFVAFQSAANNLVFSDTNGKVDVFFHDRQIGLTARVGSNSGAEPNGDSSTPVISDDGRYIAFSSRASNLVAGDTNGQPDVFVRDRVAGTTTRLSVSSAGMQVTGFSVRPAISPDGRYVVFDSGATNLVSGDNNGKADVFIRDRVAGTTSRVSVSNSGAQGNGDSDQAAISANGRYVAFRSSATSLASGDTNGVRDVFLRDLSARTTTRVSVAGSATQSNGGGELPSLDAEGRFIAFTSSSTNLVSGDTNGKPDVFVRDRVAGSTSRASLSNSGAQSNEFSFGSAISRDGRFVTFVIRASLDPNDTNGLTDVYLRDRIAGTTTLVSANPATGAASGAGLSVVSADGRLVVFGSNAGDLVADDTNGRGDIFVFDRAPSVAATVSYDAGSGLSIIDGPNDTATLVAQLDGSAYSVGAVGPLTAEPLTLGPGCVFDGVDARCDITDVPVVSVQLADGDDRFNTPGCVFALGDAVVGAGTGADIVFGGTGFDLLKGDDGDDTLTGCGGNDQLDGGAGNDIFKLGDLDTGGDVLIGGTGFDKAEYSTSAPVTVSVDGLPGDGPAGESDNLRIDVENVSTGAGDDSVTGSQSGNTLNAGAGADRLFGLGGKDFLAGDTGADQLSGQGDNDTLDGGAGIDQLLGGEGDDLLRARDGEPDELIDCGNGVDIADIDLRDVPGSSCENIDQGAINEGPNVVLGVRRTLRIRGGRLVVPVSCPRKLKHACRGTLTAARTANGLKRSARTPYRVPRGRRRTVLIRVGSAVDRGRRVFVQSVERGDTKGNKTTRRIARVSSRR